MYENDNYGINKSIAPNKLQPSYLMDAEVRDWAWLLLIERLEFESKESGFNLKNWITSMTNNLQYTLEFIKEQQYKENKNIEV